MLSTYSVRITEIYFLKSHYLICLQIMKEADLDKDNKLSLPEFEHVISKSPDFLK